MFTIQNDVSSFLIYKNVVDHIVQTSMYVSDYTLRCYGSEDLMCIF